MSKVLEVAAIVVGVAAVVLTAGTALLGAAAVAGFLGVTTATLATITAALGVAASVLSVAGGILAKKPSFGALGGAGTQLDFTADPTSGQPYVMGSARVGEAIVHEASWGDKNRYLGIVGILSCAGPIMAYDGLYADDTLISFSGGNATGYYANYMYLNTQLGARPEASALSMTAPDSSVMPNWGSSYKLSSLANAGMILVADVDNGKIYSGGTPKLEHQIRGVLCYDPRQDSTNGGSGSQRPGGVSQAETTYAYSDNPWVHHGTFALGRWVNGVRVIGPGLPSDHIDWASHIDAANVADQNGWKISGRVLSTDSKWDTLKAIAQAGGGYPIPTGAKLGCLVNTPLVSLETIQESDIMGPVSVPQMAMRRDRLNGAIPRYREPSLAYEVISGAAVRNSTYLSADGNVTKTKEIDLPLVADKKQAAQLVAYEVANSRERAPIGVVLSLYWSQYKTGDCLTLNIPSALLNNQKCVIISREIDAASNTVRFEFRTEDDSKHNWALGQTGGTPPSTSVGSTPGTGDVGIGTTDVQTLLQGVYLVGTVDAFDAGTSATIRIYGSSTTSNFTLQYPDTAHGAVSVAPKNLTGEAYSTGYYPYCDVDPTTLLPTSWGATTVYGDSLNSASHPYRISLNRGVTTPAAGGGTTTGGGTGGYGGGGTNSTGGRINSY